VLRKGKMDTSEGISSVFICSSSSLESKGMNSESSSIMLEKRKFSKGICSFIQDQSSDISSDCSIKTRISNGRHIRTSRVPKEKEVKYRISLGGTVWSDRIHLPKSATQYCQTLCVCVPSRVLPFQMLCRGGNR
jgi:hypothetical protein